MPANRILRERAMAGQTLYDKLWDSHLVKQRDDGSALIYIDRHVIHEVTSPQAFEGLRLAGRTPWRLDTNIATPDHNISTDKIINGFWSRGAPAVDDPFFDLNIRL